MPALNPKNHNTVVGFSYPSYVGEKAMVDRYEGLIWRPGDARTQVLDFTRVSERLVVEPFLTSWFDPEGIASPGFGLIWSPFLDNLGAPSYGAATRNKAYARFKDKVVGESSQLGVFAAERREAYGMIANRALGLYRAAKDLRKGDFRGFLRNLSTNPKRRHRNKLKSAAHEASGLWLEYWFGWAPTVDELFGVADTLTKDPPAGRYSGSASQAIRLTEPFNSTTSRTESAIYRARTGATVVLSNPDLFLLQSMGLANPVSILNEATPFSFVLEWFVKYGAVLDSMTDFLGLSLSDSYKSYRLEKVKRRIVHYAPGISYCAVSTVDDSFGFYRDQGLIKPTVVTAAWLDIWKSKTRAASAVSLLTQALLSFK